MNSAEVLRLESANEALKQHFMTWQCRLRQIIMREREGKPDTSITPEVFVDDESLGFIITLLVKSGPYSKIPELQHMFRKTNDPADRRKSALTLFSETYYQRSTEFSDVLTSTFQEHSEGAKALRKAGHCRLKFDAYNQSFDVHCKIWRLSENNPLWQGTYWHNLLFNPSLSRSSVILGFEPNWSRSVAEPMPGQR